MRDMPCTPVYIRWSCRRFAQCVSEVRFENTASLLGALVWLEVLCCVLQKLVRVRVRCCFPDSFLRLLQHAQPGVPCLWRFLLEPGAGAVFLPSRMGCVFSIGSLFPVRLTA